MSRDHRRIAALASQLCASTGEARGHEQAQRRKNRGEKVGSAQRAINHPTRVDRSRYQHVVAFQRPMRAVVRLILETRAQVEASLTAGGGPLPMLVYSARVTHA